VDPSISTPISGYEAADFHRACDGMEKCVVVVKAENERIVVAYNEDGFSSEIPLTLNLNGFIIDGDGGRGEIFHQNANDVGIWNYPVAGPVFGCYSGFYLHILSNCHQYENSRIKLGWSYGGRRVDPLAQVGQEIFRVLDYEVFKIVIE
jgi:hypothetical protein